MHFKLVLSRKSGPSQGEVRIDFVLKAKKACDFAMRTGVTNTKALVRPADDTIVKASRNASISSPIPPRKSTCLFKRHLNNYKNHRSKCKYYHMLFLPWKNTLCIMYKQEISALWCGLQISYRLVVATATVRLPSPSTTLRKQWENVWMRYTVVHSDRTGEESSARNEQRSFYWSVNYTS